MTKANKDRKELKENIRQVYVESALEGLRYGTRLSTLKEAIAMLEIEFPQYTDFILETEQEHYGMTTITGLRMETDEEYNIRLEADKKRSVWQAARTRKANEEKMERELYERLRLKYESN
jgi:hypothetical protein